MRRLILLLAALVAGICGADTGDSSERLFWLKSGHYAELDAFFDQLQADYEAGRKVEAEVVPAFAGLVVAKASNEKFLTQWRRERPDSYAARVVRGIYYYHMAGVSRGTAYMDRTSSQQVEGMTRYLRLAREDLNAAIPLVANPYVPVLYLLNAAGLEGGAEYSRRYYEEADRLDPRNWSAKEAFMRDLTPRWGGSYEEMQAFIDACRQQGTISAAKLNELESIIYLDELDMEERPDGVSAPEELVQQLGQLVPLQPHEASDEVIRLMARHYYRAKRYPEAVAYLEEMVRRGSNAAWIYNQLTWILVKQKRMSEAWAYAMRGVDLDDASAEYVVGSTLYRGCKDIRLPADKKEGLMWLRRSAEKGHPDAIAFLQKVGVQMEKPSLLQQIRDLIAALWDRFGQSFG